MESQQGSSCDPSPSLGVLPSEFSQVARSSKYLPSCFVFLSPSRLVPHAIFSPAQLRFHLLRKSSQTWSTTQRGSCAGQAHITADADAPHEPQD